jgi:hypothetical protein
MGFQAIQVNNLTFLLDQEELLDLRKQVDEAIQKIEGISQVSKENGRASGTLADAESLIGTYVEAKGRFPSNRQLELALWAKYFQGKLTRRVFRGVARNLRDGLAPVGGNGLFAHQQVK